MHKESEMHSLSVVHGNHMVREPGGRAWFHSQAKGKHRMFE